MPGKFSLNNNNLKVYLFPVSIRPFPQTSLTATMQAMSLCFISCARHNCRSLKVRQFLTNVKVYKQQNKPLAFYYANKALKL